MISRVSVLVTLGGPSLRRFTPSMGINKAVLCSSGVKRFRASESIGMVTVPYVSVTRRRKGTEATGATLLNTLARLASTLGTRSCRGTVHSVFTSGPGIVSMGVSILGTKTR